MLPNTLSPSVIAVRGELRVFAILDTEKHSNHHGQRAQTGEAFWPTRAWRSRGVHIFKMFVFIKFVKQIAPKKNTKTAPRAQRNPKKDPQSQNHAKKEPQKGPRETNFTRRISNMKYQILN